MKKSPALKPRAKHELAVELATWLSDANLLVIGRLPANAVEGVGVLVLPSRRDKPGAPRTSRVLAHWLVRGELRAPAVRKKIVSLQDFAREGLAWLDPEKRAAVLDFIIGATAADAPPGRSTAHDSTLFDTDRNARLSASLHALREALRERLPVSLTDVGPMALIDAVARLDRDAFYMRGRIRAGASRPVRVTAVSPEGSRVEILDSAYWYDLASSRDQTGTSAWRGFAAFLTCAPSDRLDGWLVEVEAKTGELLEVGAPKVSTHVTDVVRIVLEDLDIERPPATALRTGQVVPAITRLQRARFRNAAVETVKDFGSPPESPDVSVIVPLYRRIDLIEHQLTQFADDPGMRSAELLYVLDSPELEDELLDVARRLHALYLQPFRVAVLSENVGFAGANNLGASIARGRLLLLLNSDVFPEAPGWLDAMVRFYDSIPNAGAVGPKLLYEDDTLQHAGMFFERMSQTQPWNNEHYFKGMHRDLPAAAVSRPVLAVTGACMMIARDLYRQMGGLSGEYLQGDFEDSDLCLRLLGAGRQNWYFAGVALYHLEASSYDPQRRRLHDAFNRWLHTHLWAKRLSALDGPGPARIAATSSLPVSVGKLAKEAAAGAAPRS